MTLRLLVLTCALALPGAAQAHGNIHMRTPVLWDSPACMTVVDRSVDPVLSLHYTIPYEDTAVTPEEVADSRRHQFFALCRDFIGQGIGTPPVWITNADVAAAAALALVDPNTLGPEDILTSSTAWKGCWTRITGDDERRPITVEAAMEPVLWDTSGLPVGPRIVMGYTWEPVYNLWSKRGGVVQIVDDLDPAASPPALAISTPEFIVLAGDAVMIEGCVRVMAGATLSASWANTQDPALTWFPFAQDVPVTDETFALPFVAPPTAMGQALFLRVEVVDPLGRRFTGYMDGAASIIPNDALPEDASTGGSSTGAGDSSRAGDDDSAGSSSSTGAAADEALVRTGCGCRGTMGAPAWAALLLLVRRRRVQR